MKKFINFQSLLNKISGGVGLDLGSYKVKVSFSKSSEIFTDFSVVAFSKNLNNVIAIGEKAKKMHSSQFENIKVSFPVKLGKVVSFEACNAIVLKFLKKFYKQRAYIYGLFKPYIILSIPYNLTEVEINALIEATKLSGFRVCYIVNSIDMCALSVEKSINFNEFQFILTLGEGLSEIAIYSYGNLLKYSSFNFCGDYLNREILSYFYKKYNIDIGLTQSEYLKENFLQISNKFFKSESIEIIGQDISTMLPKTTNISTLELFESVVEVFKLLIESVKTFIESLNPNLVSLIYKNGLYISGGISKVKGLDDFLSKNLGFKVILLKNPDLSAINGIKYILENSSLIKNYTIKDLLIRE